MLYYVGLHIGGVMANSVWIWSEGIVVLKIVQMRIQYICRFFFQKLSEIKNPILLKLLNVLKLCTLICTHTICLLIWNLKYKATCLDSQFVIFPWVAIENRWVWTYKFKSWTFTATAPNIVANSNDYNFFFFYFFHWSNV